MTKPRTQHVTEIHQGQVGGPLLYWAVCSCGWIANDWNTDRAVAERDAARHKARAR